MNTKIFDVRSIPKDSNALLSQLKEAAEMLADGKVIAFPTETVYGLGANALDENAVNKIFEAKGRPSDNPLIVHIAGIAQVEELVSEIPQTALTLMNHFWPGPLSIIMNKSPLIPDNVTAGLNTVAIRMPKNSEAFILLKLAGCPVAAPSANISGKPSPTKPEHVVHDLEGKVDGIVLGRICDVGIESTVIDVSTAQPVILRPGIITREEIEAVIGPVAIAGQQELTEETPKAPGMKYTHYSPDAPVILYRGTPEAVFTQISQRAVEELSKGKKIGILATDDTSSRYRFIMHAFNSEGSCCSGSADSSSCQGAVPYVISAGSRDDLETVAHNIFDTLRDFDLLGVDLILSESFDSDGIGYSLMNRLLKAATEVQEV